MDRQTRGSAINAYFQYIKKKWGQDGLDQCLKDLDLKEELDDVKYYPDDLMIQVLKWIRENYGDKALENGGNYVVKNLGIIAWLVKMASPKFIARRFQKNMKELYTFGHVEVEELGPKTIKIQLFDTYAGEERCIAWVGVCKGTLELTNNPGRITKTKCVGDGKKCCEYKMDWT